MIQLALRIMESEFSVKTKGDHQQNNFIIYNVPLTTDIRKQQCHNLSCHSSCFLQSLCPQRTLVLQISSSRRPLVERFKTQTHTQSRTSLAMQMALQLVTIHGASDLNLGGQTKLQRTPLQYLVFLRLQRRSLQFCLLQQSTTMEVFRRQNAGPK